MTLPVKELHLRAVYSFSSATLCGAVIPTNTYLGDDSLPVVMYQNSTEQLRNAMLHTNERYCPCCLVVFQTLKEIV